MMADVRVENATREYILELAKKKIERIEAENDQLRAELARIKPDWDDAPANATHRAIDIDGDWLWFIGEPHGSDDNGWILTAPTLDP